MSNQSLELKYHDITELYDLADQLAETVESEFVADPETQLNLIEPLVEQVGEAADILAEEFLAVAGKSKAENQPRRGKTEGALRKLYIAIENYKKTVAAAKAGKPQKSLLNIADPIVEKIKRQVEVIVANFIDFLDLSLDRIMQRSHIEELRQRQEKIALMLHEAQQAKGLESH